jgi:hypothetical protein
MTDSESVPSNCETDGCHRDPEVQIYNHIETEGHDDIRTWRCDPCVQAMIHGNQVPGGNIKVIDRA